MNVINNLKKLTWFGAEPVFSFPKEGVVKTVIIFLHGSGDTGEGVHQWVSQLHPLPLPTTAIIFPTAPPRPYTLFGGAQANVWHDRTELSLSAEEDIVGIDAMCDRLAELVSQVGQCGVKVVLGGFSQGGHLALHGVFRRNIKVASAFALSSFLSETSLLYTGLTGASTPLYMSSGSSDGLVPLAWTKDSVARLKEGGVEVVYSQVDGLDHQMGEGQLDQMFQWIKMQTMDCDL